MVFMFIKSTMGLAVFGFHEVYQKSGYLLGLLISFVYIYTVIHGCMRMITFAEEAEEKFREQGLTYSVDSYFELVEVCLAKRHPKLSRVLGPLTFYLVFFSTIGYSLSTALALGGALEESFGWSPLLVKLVILVVLVVSLALMIEPEKLVYLSYLLTVLVVGLVLVSAGLSADKLARDGVSPHVRAVRWQEMSLSCGYVITSLEVVNYILNIRRLMKDRAGFPAVGYFSLYLCSLMYLVPGMLVYLALEGIPDPKLQELYYRTFISYRIVRVMSELMNVNFIYGMTSLTIYNMEMLEKIRLIKPLLRDKEDNLRSINVLVLRIVFVACVLVISIYVTDLRLVYALIGIFLNSFIGMIIPSSMGIWRDREFRRKDSILMKFNDWACLVAGLFAILLFFVDLLPGMK